MPTWITATPPETSFIVEIQLLIIISLTIAATFIVVVVSAGLVIHKALNSHALRKKKRLYSIYSDLVAEILLQELPPLPPQAKTSAIFEQYEEMIAPLKSKIAQLSGAKKLLEKEILRQALIDFAIDVAGEVSDRLVYFFYSFGFVEEEIALLSHRHWWIRAQAARDAGLLKARRAITALTAALEDEHHDVRIQAMESLVRLVGVDALRTIFRVSKNLSQWTCVELSTIVMEYSESAVPYLIEGLEATDQSVILFCIEMLAEIGFVTAVEPLRRMAQDYPNIIVRAKAIEALGRLGDERAEALLSAYLENPSPLIRLQSMRALSKIGAPKVIPKLVKRVLQGDLPEKIIAARAIAASGEEGIQVLQTFVTEEDSTYAAVAGQILEELDVAQELS